MQLELGLPLGFLGIDGFLNAGLLIGTTAAAVPLVIHLLNRQRHKPMPWGAMRFVLAAYKKTRRRAQLENLLLLLLRMAAVALLALAITRPFSGAESPLAQLAESRRDVILVIDGSASTGYRRDVRTVFESIVERARDIALELDGARSDRLRLIVAGERPRLVAWREPDEALAVLGTLTRPYDEPLELATALAEVARLLEEDQAQGGVEGTEVRLLCDLQRRSFETALARPERARALSNEAASSAAEAAPGTPSDGATDVPSAVPTNVLAEQLDRLQQLGVKLLVEDLGATEPTPRNLALTSIEPLGAVLGSNVPFEVAVNVANFDDAPASSVRVSLAIDGDQRLPYRPLELAARGRGRVTFPVVIESAGDHVLTAKLEADDLTFDDERVHVVNVPPPARVLLVDGEAAAETERDEVGYLRAVLDPPRGDGVAVEVAPFEPTTIEPFALREDALDLAQFDVLWLANVENLSESVVEKLEQRVAAGASLIISLGKRVEPGLWNARLFRADGSGLLPAELGSRVSIGRREGYFRVGEFSFDHPALTFFADERWRPLFTEVPIYEFFTSQPLESARVLARLDDDAQSPLLVERTYDRGKVFLWTSTIDAEWTRLPESARTLVPLTHEWLRYAARPPAPARNLALGATLVADFTSFPRGPVVALPDGSRRAIPDAPTSIGATTWRLVAPATTERPGLYELEIEGAPPVPFAIQVDAREGDLERLAPGELAGLHPALALVGSGAARESDDGSEPSRQGELWRPLAIACFVALALETLWAAWVGRRRRIP